MLTKYVLVVLKNILEWKKFSSESAVYEQFRLAKAIKHAKAKNASRYGYGISTSPERELIFKTAIIFEQSKPAQSVSYKIRMDNGDWNDNEALFSNDFMENKNAKGEYKLSPVK
jgi:hypothetical protein